MISVFVALQLLCYWNGKYLLFGLNHLLIDDYRSGMGIIEIKTDEIFLA